MEQLGLDQKPEESLELLDIMEPQTAKRLPTYHPTSMAFANKLLDLVDSYTGMAGFVQKFFSFAFFGGLGALVNLAVYALIIMAPLPLKFTIHDTIAYLAAFEISVIANFIPNDYFTFRHSAGRERSWLMRGLRFNITSITGGILTYILHIVLLLVHVSPLISQAIALIIVMFYNFAFHHFFTYRRVKTSTN